MRKSPCLSLLFQTGDDAKKRLSKPPVPTPTLTKVWEAEGGVWGGRWRPDGGNTPAGACNLLTIFESYSIDRQSWKPFPERFLPSSLQSSSHLPSTPCTARDTRPRSDRVGTDGALSIGERGRGGADSTGRPPALPETTRRQGATAARGFQRVRFLTSRARWPSRQAQWLKRLAGHMAADVHPRDVASVTPSATEPIAQAFCAGAYSKQVRPSRMASRKSRTAWVWQRPGAICLMGKGGCPGKARMDDRTRRDSRREQDSRAVQFPPAGFGRVFFRQAGRAAVSVPIERIHGCLRLRLSVNL